MRLLLVLISLFVVGSVSANNGGDEGYFNSGFESMSLNSTTTFTPLPPPPPPPKPTVYILYRDSKGEMATDPLDPALWEQLTGHVGFYIVSAEGEPYLIDVIPDIGVRIVKEEPLLAFKGDGEQMWAFEVINLDPVEIENLIEWASERVGLPYV